MKKEISKNFWTKINEPLAVYPWLAQDEDCDVCIVGGGVTGSLCAMYFAKAGINTVLVTASGIGYGASSSMSGSAELRPFGGLTKLQDKVGVQNAIEYCKNCRDAITAIEEAVKAFPDDCGFYRTDSFVFSTSPENNADLHKEYLSFLHNGFDVEIILPDEAGEIFSFATEKGMIIKNGAMVVDPYKICQNAAAMAVECGAGVYEYTEIDSIAPQKHGVELTTTIGKKIKARRVIFASGEENKAFLKDDTVRCAGFSVVSEVANETPGWYNKSAVTICGNRESTSYITPDNRIVIYGMETSLNPFHAVSSINAINSVFTKRCEILDDNIKSMFSAIESVDNTSYYASCGLTGTDGLPFIGDKNGYPYCFFAVCGGKNSILHAQLAAKRLLTLYSKRSS